MRGPVSTVEPERARLSHRVVAGDGEMTAPMGADDRADSPVGPVKGCPRSIGNAARAGGAGAADDRGTTIRR